MTEFRRNAMNKCRYESAYLLVLDQAACEATVLESRTYTLYAQHEAPAAWYEPEFSRWYYDILPHGGWKDKYVDLKELNLF